MAQDNVLILKVDTKTGEAVKSVNDLRENITKLKDNIGKLTVGSDEYQKALESLKINQTALRNAMHATTASLEDVSKAATGAGGSYNALVARMAAMKEELRATDTSTKQGMKRFQELARDINSVNDQLKAMDAAQGNFQRNVGMYTSKISKMGDAFRATAGGAGSMINPLKNVNVGLNAISKTPVIAILGLLANALNLVVKNLNSSEENMRAVQKAMASLQPVADLVTRVLQKLGTVVVKLAEGVSNLFKKVFPELVKSEEDVISVTEKDIELQDKQREAIKRNAEDEREIAKLRADAADKANLTAEQRIALLEKAGALELRIMGRQKEIAQREYEIAELNAKRAGNSKEENDALAQAYANKVKIETEYYKKSREITGAISAARAEATARDTKAANEAKTAANNAATAAKAEAKAEVETLKLKKEALEERLKHVKHFSDEEKQIKADIIKATYDMEKASAEKTLTNEEQKNEALKLAKEKYANSLKAQEEWEIQRADELRKLQLSNELAGLEQGSFEYLAKAVELKHFELDTMHQLESESDEEFKARQLAKEKEYQNSKAALIKAGFDTAQKITASTVSILSSVADAYQDDIKARQKAGKISEEEAEKEFERVKAIQIAIATINMLQGIASALSGVFTTKSGPWDIALAAIQAAAIGVSGGVNIAKIRNTQLGSSSSSSTPSTASAMSAASVAAPTIATTIPEVRTITNASDEDAINSRLQNQRVYILSSDIEASQDSIKARTQETSF